MSQTDPSANPEDSELYQKARELVQQLNAVVASLSERGFDVRLDVSAQHFVARADMPMITIRIYKEF